MDTKWDLTYHVDKMPTLRNPVLIEGLPGIGSVGKIVVDYIIDSQSATKLCSFTSFAFPPSVFVAESQLIELPSIGVYHAKGKKRDYLFLSGDMQPTTDKGCYSFSESVLDVLENLGVKRIITLGGIGLSAVPKIPQVFCTGTEAGAVDHFTTGVPVNGKLYGVVGPICGVTGVLPGLGSRRNITGVTLLVETYAHPMYLGISGSRALLEVLAKKLDLPIDLVTFNKEISALETDKKKKPGKLGALASRANYIG
jgi:uncharacterized protein